MHRKTPSWNGVDRPSMVSGSSLQGRDFASCGDLEDACCNRRHRSHSHDLPDPRVARRTRAGVALCFAVAAVLGVAALRPAANPLRRAARPRVLLEDDDGRADAPAPDRRTRPKNAAVEAAADADSRYESLLKNGFGPPDAETRDVNSTTRSPTRSKTQRKRDEKHAKDAEKRRLAKEAEALDAFERRKADRKNAKQKERDEKREKREVHQLMQGGAAADRGRRR